MRIECTKHPSAAEVIPDKMKYMAGWNVLGCVCQGGLRKWWMKGEGWIVKARVFPYFRKKDKDLKKKWKDLSYSSSFVISNPHNLGGITLTLPPMLAKQLDRWVHIHPFPYLPFHFIIFILPQSILFDKQTLDFDTWK